MDEKTSRPLSEEESQLLDLVVREMTHRWAFVGTWLAFFAFVGGCWSNELSWPFRVLPLTMVALMVGLARLQVRLPLSLVVYIAVAGLLGLGLGYLVDG